MTAWIRKDLQRNVMGALYDEARGQEDAERKELDDELLEQWLERWPTSDGHNDAAG